MRIVVNMSHELYEVTDDDIDRWNVTSEKKIGDTYFLKTKGGTYFSCHENFWEDYKIEKRNKKINQIIQK